MARFRNVSRDEAVNLTSALDGWTLGEGSISKQFAFADFVRAWSFMSGVALVAESMNHHPNWSNVYNRVDVALSTHDAGGLTDLDFELAATMDRLAGGS